MSWEWSTCHSRTHVEGVRRRGARSTERGALRRQLCACVDRRGDPRGEEGRGSHIASADVTQAQNLAEPQRLLLGLPLLAFPL